MRAGQLVVATPVLTDPSFARTVVLLLQADEQDGALGLVLNRPTGTGVDEVLPDWAPLAAGPPVVFSGGPVQPQAAVCLGHRRLGSRPTAAYAEVEGVPGGSVGTVDLDAAPGELASVPRPCSTPVKEVRSSTPPATWPRPCSPRRSAAVPARPGARSCSPSSRRSPSPRSWPWWPD